MKITEDNIDDAVLEASGLFWEYIRKTFPQIKTTSVSIDIAMDLDLSMRLAIEQFIDNNPK